MSENVRENHDQTRNTDGHPLHFSTFFLDQDVDKEARIRLLKEKQNDERHKKLEEIRAQALAAQKFKEQKETERRRRLEEMRLKDDSRRQLVEERKRAINEAERDRLESILRRNQEREARIEAKRRNEKSNIIFAFGSSTPRMLDPTDASVSFWGHRRATSTQNITTASNGSLLSRRQSERDFDVGSKKRATSAGGLERSGDGFTSPTTPAGCASGYLGRRRTDLVPTIPSRDSSLHSSTSRKSLNHSPASSRPSSSMSQQSTNSVTSSVNIRHRVSNTPRRPRPISIAVTGVTHDLRNSNEKGENKPPLPKTRKSLSKTNTSEKIDKAQSKTQTPKSPADESAPKTAESKQKYSNSQKIDKRSEKVLDKVESEGMNDTKTTLIDLNTDNGANQESIVNDAIRVQSPLIVENSVQTFIDNEREATVAMSTEIQTVITDSTLSTSETKSEENKLENNESNEMSTSMSKPRITTEEEAKAALAEKRRLIREEAERKAELERQRLEAEQKAELERQQKEEEQARLLAEMQRQAEQERLQEAIREAQKREEEERLRKEEELRQKLVKEESDRKAKEEAERQKVELQKKLENEEKEREERRRRVEMIMSRTRGKTANSNTSQQNSQDKNENPPEKQQVADENKINEDSERIEKKLNGTKQENGKDSSSSGNEKVVDLGIDNIISDESVKNANTVPETMNADSLNSNSTWQASSQQYDL